MALALHKSINNEDDEEGDLCPTVPTPNDAGSYPAASDPTSVVKCLQNNVIDDCHLFFTMRREVILSWVMQLWQRELKKSLWSTNFPLST